MKLLRNIFVHSIGPLTANAALILGFAASVLTVIVTSNTALAIINFIIVFFAAYWVLLRVTTPALISAMRDNLRKDRSTARSNTDAESVQTFQKHVKALQQHWAAEAEEYRISSGLSDEQFGLEREMVNAAFDGDEDEVRRLLNVGVPADSSNGHVNALHAAIENQKINCVRLLLQHGAQLERLCHSLTPLAEAVDIACDSTNQAGLPPEKAPHEIIDLLLAYGADPRPGIRAAKTYGYAILVRKLEAAIPIDEAI